MLTASSAMVTGSFLEVGSVYTRNLIFKGDLVKEGSDQHLLRSLSRDFRDLLDHDFLAVGIAPSWESLWRSSKSTS